MPVRPLALAALLALAACDTPADLASIRLDALSHDPAALVGTWDLVSVTSSGFGGPVETVAVAPGTETYTFRADGTFEHVREGVAQATGTYEVEGASLRLGDGARWFGIDGDRLYFDFRPMDGPLQAYRRR